jgi:hypothetical protein
MSISGFRRAGRAKNFLGYKLETTQSILFNASSSIANTAAFLRKKAGLRRGGRGESEIISALEKCSK